MNINYLMIHIFIFWGICNNIYSQGGWNWKTEAPGIWKVSVGKPEKVNLLSELSVTSRLDKLTQMGDGTLPIAEDDLAVEIIDGKIYIRFQL